MSLYYNITIFKIVVIVCCVVFLSEGKNLNVIHLFAIKMALVFNLHPSNNNLINEQESMKRRNACVPYDTSISQLSRNTQYDFY